MCLCVLTQRKILVIAVLISNIWLLILKCIFTHKYLNYIFFFIGESKMFEIDSIGISLWICNPLLQGVTACVAVGDGAYSVCLYILHCVFICCLWSHVCIWASAWMCVYVCVLRVLMRAAAERRGVAFLSVTWKCVRELSVLPSYIPNLRQNKRQIFFALPVIFSSC